MSRPESDALAEPVAISSEGARTGPNRQAAGSSTGADSDLAAVLTLNDLP